MPSIENRSFLYQDFKLTLFICIFADAIPKLFTVGLVSNGNPLLSFPVVKSFQVCQRRIF